MTRVLLTAAIFLAATALGQGLNLLPDQMSADQKKLYSDRARAFTGKPCQAFTLYSAAPNGTPTVFRNGVSAMLKYQAQANIRALKQNMQATEFEEHAQQGKQEQYIYNGLVGGKTVSLVCLLN